MFTELTNVNSKSRFIELMDFKKAIILFLIIAMSIYVSGKGKWILGAGTSHGFNSKELYIWKHTVEKSMSHGVYLKLGYEFKLFYDFTLAISPGFLQHYDEVGINNINVETFSYNFELPAEINYYFHKKLSAHAGVAVQDYRAFEEFALERSYNVRLNLNLGVSYHFNKHWAFELTYSRILSDRRNAFLIRNYPNHIRLGMRYRFNIKKSQDDQ